MPAVPHRPRLVVFDVVETLFSLDPVADALRPLGVDLDLFFARLLRDGFALAAADDHAPFGALAQSTLDSLAPAATTADHDRLVDAFGRLPAHPDAAPALRRLAADDVRAVALTNGGADNTATLLDRAGLTSLVERVFSVDEVGIWKPTPAPYRFVAEALALDPADIALVAVHSWDVHGARLAGLVTGWCARLEGERPAVFEAADVIGPDLVTVVEGLLALD